MASAGSVIGGTIVESGELLRRDSKELDELKEKLQGRFDDTRLQELRNALIPDFIGKLNTDIDKLELILQGQLLSDLNDLVGLLSGFTTKDKLVLVQDALELEAENAKQIEKLLAQAHDANDTAKIAEFEATLGEFKASIEGIIAERDELRRLLEQERAQGEESQGPFGPGPFETRRRQHVASSGLTLPVNLPTLQLPGGISAVTGGGLSRGGAGGLVPDGDPVSEHFIARLREADDASWRFNDALVANRGSLERLGTTGERVFGDLTSVLRRFIEGGLAAANDNERTLYDAPARLVA